MSQLRQAYQFIVCSPWVGFFNLIAIMNIIWISALCVCHVYQAVFLALTTNERINLSRYKHFYSKDGSYHNPFR
jgi:hypothetical protein